MVKIATISLHESEGHSITAWVTDKSSCAKDRIRFAHVHSGYLFANNINDFYELDDILCEINAKIAKFMSEQHKRVEQLRGERL